MTDNNSLSALERYRQLVKELQELASILNNDLLLTRIVESAVMLCDAEGSWILFPDQNQQLLSIETSWFDKKIMHRGISSPMGTSLEGWVYSHQLPVMINDLNQPDDNYGGSINLPNVELRSILCVPLYIKNKPIGILEVANKRNGDFSLLDQEILASFASQAAIFIDNTYRHLQSDLLAELVHELRTPLASLNTALYLLQRPDLPESKREQISNMIQAEFNRLTNLTTSYLDYARFESGRVKYRPILFDLAQLLNESVDIMQMQIGSKEIRIYLDVSAQPLYITADKDKIKQVILNLINNAIKYSHNGGEIHITATESLSGVSFSVQDNGQGIPVEYLPHLFERFFRVPTLEKTTKGTGLGLTIVRQIVEGHKGKIEVESTVGIGSTFTVQLPRESEFMPHQVVSAL
jgi:signal transduction histidine kinase